MPPKIPKNASNNLSTKKDLCCCWTDADDTIVVQILRQQKEAGNQSSAEWESQVWTAIEAALTAEGIIKGGPKTVSKCQDHWTTICCLFTLNYKYQLPTISKLAQKKIPQGQCIAQGIWIWVG